MNLFSYSILDSCRKNDLGLTKRFEGLAAWFKPKIIIEPPKPKPETNPLKVKTNVKNNVMLYRFEKPYMYKCGIVFAGAVLIGCLAMADNVFMILCKGMFDKNKDLLTRIMEHLLPLSFVVIGLVAGKHIFYICF